MDCGLPYEKRVSDITVYEWKDSDNYITHKFNNEDDPITIYDDDTIIRAIVKIAVMLKKNSLPYVWRKRSPFLFTIKNTGWQGYNANPWKCQRDGTEDAKPTIVYDFNTLLHGKDFTFNILFKEDAPALIQNEHFFPNLERTIPTLRTLQQEDAILDTLNAYSEQQHRALQRTSGQPCVFSHLVYNGTPLDVVKKDYFLQYLFDGLHSSSFIPFIQWMEDPSKVLYKVHKKHTIPPAYFAHWSSVDRLPKTESALTMYSPLFAGKRNIYARIFLDLSGFVSVTYHIDAREKIDMDVINKHKIQIFDILSKYTGIKYNVTQDGISLRTEIISKEASLSSLAGIISNIFPLFHVIKYQPGKIDVIYKRASNYQNGIQLSEYIHSKLRMGIPVAEVIESLTEMGIPQADILSNLETANDMESKKIETGMLLHISKLSYGYKVHIENAPSLEEVRRALHWLRACIIHIQKVAEKKAAVKKKVPSPLSLSSSSPSPQPQQKSKSSTKSNALAESIGSDDLDFIGGAVGKEHQRYFLNMLQEADPILFNDTDNNYARMCQASAFHQPVVVTKEEKDKLIEEGYGDAIDNMVTYGSDPSNQNVYFCPRIWCPVSKKPMTYQQYIDNNKKCPSGEDPKLMYEHSYWGNSPDTKHYIGFHKNKTSSGLCLPCCYVKPLSKAKEKECVNPTEGDAIPEPNKTKKTRKNKLVDKSKSPETQVIETPKDDSYLMTHVAPLPDGRSGNIPQVLHEIVLPQVTYQICHKSLSSQECLVRHGILHQGDSLMNAIAYSLSLKSKNELVALIKSKLDPITFLALENGHIVSAFTNPQGMIPKEHKGMVKEMYTRLRKYPDYVSKFQLKGLDNDEFKLSRELQLYDAWLKFMDYLSSDEPKSPYHLYIVMQSLGYLLVVWDKEGTNEVGLRCPLYSSVSQLIRNVEEHHKTIMLLHENGVYEPLELKKRNSEGKPIIETKYTSKLTHMLNACEETNHEDQYFEFLKTIDIWSQSLLMHPKPFTFETVILSPGLRIHHILTSGNILITLPGDGLSLGYLPRVLKETSASHVAHHEDIANTVKEVHVMRSDFSLFARKLQSVGFGFIIGSVLPGANDSAYHHTNLTIPPISQPPIILLRGNNDADNDFAKEEANLESKWQQLQRMIGKMFLANFDTLVKPTLTKSREERIQTLMRTFPNFPNKKRLQVALEEMPLEYGKDALAKWVRFIGYEEDKPFFDSRVHDNNKHHQWLFSQQAVEIGIPSFVSAPPKAHGIRPKDSLKKTSMEKKPYTTTTLSNAEPPLPAMLDPETCVKGRLPSKWTQMRQYEWSKFNMFTMREYTKQSVPQLIEWIAKRINVPIFWGDVKYATAKFVIASLYDERGMLLLLEDPSMNHEWAQYIGKSYKQPKQLWERGFRKMSREDVKRLWDTISTSGRLWPADVDLYLAAQLMDTSILVLHRSRYGGGKQDGKRGDLDDLVASASLFTRIYTKSHVQSRPMCILYKDTNKESSVYSVLTDEQNIFLFPSLNHCPKDIRNLVEYYIDTQGKHPLHE
jgi:hypothetical protein